MNDRMMIVGCTRRKTNTAAPVLAYQLYQGGIVPALRDRLGDSPARWSAVRFLSARHGLIPATMPLLPYNQRLTTTRARELRPAVQQELATVFGHYGTPAEVLVVCEPQYLVLLADLFAIPARPVVHWVSDVRDGWPQAAAVLDEWRWP